MNRWLLDYRNRHGKLTQEKVATLANVDRSYYTKIENGVIPSVKVAKRIAAVLGFDWTLFFNQTCDEKSQICVIEKRETGAICAQDAMNTHAKPK